MIVEKGKTLLITGGLFLLKFVEQSSHTRFDPGGK